MLFVLLLVAAPDRAEINARALELGLPVFWRADDNSNGKPDAAELVATWPATAVPDGAVTQLLAGAKQPAGEPEEIARQRPQKLSALYPSALQQQDGFCETLLEHRYARALGHPFAVVRGEGDTLKPVPYHIVFSSEMDAVAAALKDAAAVLPEDEAAMEAYLLAAGQAFRDNQWASGWCAVQGSPSELRAARLHRCHRRRG